MRAALKARRSGKGCPVEFRANGGVFMKSTIVKRSIVVAGHKTSLSLEDAFWIGLKEIVRERHMTWSPKSIPSGNSAICHRPFGFSCSTSIKPNFPTRRNSPDDLRHCARFFVRCRAASGSRFMRRLVGQNVRLVSCVLCLVPYWRNFPAEE
jgi:hypothetical protein